MDIEQVKQLRQETQVSMIECRNALEEAKGNFEEAKNILRKKGIAVAEKKAAREASEGIIASYVHSNAKVGALVELRCETDFVARSEAFRTLGHEIAMQIAAQDPKYLDPEDIPEEMLEAEREIYREEFQGSGKSEAILNQIIEGKIKKYATDHSLLTQPYIRDEDKTVGDLINEYVGRLGENIKVERFVRYHI